MRFIRKSLILTHRYLGILLCVPFLVWFVSGIAMIYAREMPTLTPQARLEHLPVLDLAGIRLSATEARQRSELGTAVTAVTLLTLLGRPAYRFDGGGGWVFADTGESLEMNAERAALSARLFAHVPAGKIHPAGILTQVDQWTIGHSREMPLHKFTIDDDAGTELYVSERTGEVAVLTTRSGRALAWVSAIPHWLYFEAIRSRPQVWRRVVLWLSGLGIVSALIGLVLGIIQYRRRPPHIPYAGWLRWHYITGIIFGVFTLTWVFSGFLSMEPWYWTNPTGLVSGLNDALEDVSLDLGRFSTPLPSVPGAKEMEWLLLQGKPYYRIQTAAPDPVLVSAETLQVRKEPFNTDSIVSQLSKAGPYTATNVALLSDYDSYYYSFNRKAPLPVLRVKFDDPSSTWVYVDPRLSQVVSTVTHRERIQRWIYHGLHSLDFSFWYYSRPAWDIGMVGLSMGGVALSLIGVVISWKRVARTVLRRTRR